MLFSTAGQAQIFLVMAALGAALGLLHDGMELLQLLLGRRALCWTLEGVFFAFAALCVFFALVRLNGGELRAYTFLGLGVGWCLYLLSLAPLLVKLRTLVARGLKTIGNNRFFRLLLR